MDEPIDYQTVRKVIVSEYITTLLLYVLFRIHNPYHEIGITLNFKNILLTQYRTLEVLNSSERVRTLIPTSCDLNITPFF